MNGGVLITTQVLTATPEQTNGIDVSFSQTKKQHENGSLARYQMVTSMAMAPPHQNHKDFPLPRPTSHALLTVYVYVYVPSTVYIA